MEGETVTVVLDPASDTRGYYGRLLGYVAVNDSFQLNYALVEAGYARVYDSTFTQSERFYDAEARAQDAGRGLWGFGDGADAPAGVRVARVHADAAGDDRENLNDEYVVIENAGESAVAMGGWTVTDAAGHEYVVPEGFELAAGAAVRLHTGAGTDDADDLYWGADGPVWNNGGDTVTVVDATGAVVAEREYG